jgi:hypothetical protein
MTDAERSKLIKEQQEAEQREKDELRKFQRRLEKIQKEEKKEEALLAPVLKNNALEWKRKESNKNIFQGFFNEELYFEIKPGILTFSLQFKNEDLLKHLNKKNKSTNINSPYLRNLQKRANDILLEFVARS